MPEQDNPSAPTCASPRTLSEIIDAARDGDRPTPDECYHAMLMLDALATLTRSDLRRAAFADDKIITVKVRAEQDHQRWRRAFKADPVAWIGDNMPGAPGQARRRQAGKNLAAHVLAKFESGS